LLIEEGIPIAIKPKSREPRSAKTAHPSHGEEHICFRAYGLYEQRGRVDRFALDDCLQAEAEVLGTQKKPKSKVAKRHRHLSGGLGECQECIQAPLNLHTVLESQGAESLLDELAFARERAERARRLGV
jgi:hypothetical protein